MQEGRDHWIELDSGSSVIVAAGAATVIALAGFAAELLQLHFPFALLDHPSRGIDFHY